MRIWHGTIGHDCSWNTGEFNAFLKYPHFKLPFILLPWYKELIHSQELTHDILSKDRPCMNNYQIVFVVPGLQSAALVFTSSFFRTHAHLFTTSCSCYSEDSGRDLNNLGFLESGPRPYIPERRESVAISKHSLDITKFNQPVFGIKVNKSAACRWLQIELLQ